MHSKPLMIFMAAAAVTLFVSPVRGNSLAPADEVVGAADTSVFLSADSTERLFVRDILPLLKTRCFACHGDNPEDLKGSLDLSSRAALMRGGDSGSPAIVVGDPSGSPLIDAVRRTEELSSAMPPKENDALSDDDIKALEAWVQAGARWPDAETIARLQEELASAEPRDGVRVPTSGGLSEDWTNRVYPEDQLWAYRPLRIVPDAVFQEAGHPIDAILAHEQPEVVAWHAPRASREVLLRRLAFDLTGLPPRPGDGENFLSDLRDEATALAALRERFLSSPHYGEHWATHWLDVVRYADSSGFANDFERGNAWRYRDYVVRAFQHDKPYDEFLREQLAGDEINPDNPEMLVAAGFLRMGPWELTGMEVARVARQRFLDDVTDAVGQVFMGHMLQCARCHDHKFDPVPTKDYYSLQAVFATTQIAERKAAFLPDENLAGMDTEEAEVRRRIAYYQQLEADVTGLITVESGRQWLVENGIATEEFDEVVAALKKDGGERVLLKRVRSEMERRGIHPDRIPPRHAGFQPRDFGIERVARKGLARMKWRQERCRPVAFSVYSGPTPSLKNIAAPLTMAAARKAKGEVEATYILTGGDPFSRMTEVTPAVLSAANAFMEGDESDSLRIPSGVQGRRAALAEWLVRERNPLTARVMVNRLWQWHFGRPLAGNPNNLGATGARPSHPLLLDYLASEFIRSGWSVKHMHRLILSSDAWARASVNPHSEELAKADPQGISYAAFRPRRLTSDELRDAMLAVSGELNRQVGGIPCRPEISMEVALQPRMVMGTFAEAWQPNKTPDERNRRSIYVLRLRGLRDPLSEVFQAPNPDLSCEAREQSLGTPQVFALFNSPRALSRATAFALSLTARHGSDGAACLQDAWKRCYARAPEEEELAAALRHWELMSARHRSMDVPRRDYPQQVLRQAVEENTGEPFEFTEPLENFEDYVADPQLADLTAEQRGLAEVCLMLLNSNEFFMID